MHKISFVLCASLCLVICACGPSAEQKAEQERQRADSIATAEAEIAAKREAFLRDSIENAEKMRLKQSADSALRAELLPDFTKIDESNGFTKYVVKGTSLKHNTTSAYVSFTVDNNRATDFEINVSLITSRWFDISKAILFIDDEKTEFSVDKPSDDVNDGVYREWFSSSISSSELDKLEKASKMSVEVSNDKDDTRKISLNIANVKKTIKLYRAFGS